MSKEKFAKKDIYSVDASELVGNLTHVYTPKTVSEICNIVKTNQKITIRGAGTGLVGGSVPQGDVILSMIKMNKIINFDEKGKIVEVESGVILDELNDFLLPIETIIHSNHIS